MAEATAAAQDIQNMTIADQSLICAQKFKLVTRQLQVSELGEPVGNINPKPDVALNNMGVSAEMLTDTWVRFNIWTANIGALSRGRASLDYRLRHADVREEVLRLLKHMNASLSHRKFSSPLTRLSRWIKSAHIVHLHSKGYCFRGKGAGGLVFDG